MSPIRFRFSWLLAVLVLLAPPLSAQPPRWTPLGPYGGTIVTLDVLPNNPSVLYAGSTYGVIQSTDAGASWHLLPGFPGPGVVALDPARPTNLYAFTADTYPARVFKSADGGSHWRATGPSLPSDLIPTALAVDSAPAARIYLGTLGKGLLWSADDGVTWHQGLTTGGLNWITALAVPRRLPGTAGTAFAGTRNGLYRTVNSGASWTLLKRGLPAAAVEALAVSRSNPRTVYAGFSGLGIYRSADGGASWRPAGTPSPGRNVDALAVHPGSPLTVYAGSNQGGVFKTTDGGAHWSSTGLPRRVRVRALAIDSTSAAALYAGAAAPDPNVTGIDPGGVLRSADGGATWTRGTQGLTGLTAGSVAIDPADPAVVLAGLWGPGLFRSPDRGGHWNLTPVGLPSTQKFGVVISQVLATAPGVFYAGGSTFPPLWKSTDSGLTWSSLPGLVRGEFEALRILRADPLEPDTLFAVLSGNTQRSTDGGASWAPFPLTGVSLCNFTDLAVARSSASAPAVLYAVGAQIGPLNSCGTFRLPAAFRSSDGGTSWTEIDAGLPGQWGKIVARVAVDPRDPGTVYVGMGYGSDGVWKSTDSGSSWQQAGLGGFEITALAFSPDPGVLWAGTAGKIFRSGDGGATWQDLGGGRGLFPNGFAFDPSDPRRVYVASSGGVWTAEVEP